MALSVWRNKEKLKVVGGFTSQRRKPKKIVFFPRICYFNFFYEGLGQEFWVGGGFRAPQLLDKRERQAYFAHFSGGGMELVCEKYKEKVDSEQAVCRRPTEYCKFRSACLIHFLAREKAGKEKKEAENTQGEGR